MYSFGPKKKSLAIQTLSSRSGRKNWITIEISSFIFASLTHLYSPFFNFPHLLQILFSSSHIWTLLSFIFLPFSCSSLHISSIIYCLHISSFYSCLQETETCPVAYRTAFRITVTWMKGINIYLFFTSFTSFLPPLCSFHFHPLLSSHLFFNYSSPFCSLSLSTSVSSNIFSLNHFYLSYCLL